eukprot:scaffold88956_cov54-Attheya_sp.AAC.3
MPGFTPADDAAPAGSSDRTAGYDLGGVPRSAIDASAGADDETTSRAAAGVTRRERATRRLQSL